MSRKGSDFAGLSVAIVTPFKNGEVDYARLILEGRDNRHGETGEIGTFAGQGRGDPRNLKSEI